MNVWASRTAKVAAAAACAAAQVTVMPALTVAGVKPDFPLMVTVVAGLSHGVSGAAGWGALVGLGLDACSFAPFGTHTVLLALVGAGMGVVQPHVNRRHVLVPVVLCLAVSLVYALAYWMIQSVAWSGFTIREAMVWQAVKGAGYSALWAAAAYQIYQRVLVWRDRRRIRRRPWKG